ncbi:MAG: fumarylacetoacetase, partial [Candidatus Krumholzibacteriia bacterium]
MDRTVDPSVRSFVAVAPESHFPLQNLPYGVFSPGPRAGRRIGTRIGDLVVDLAALEDAGLLDDAGLPRGIFSHPVLNPFMDADPQGRRLVRRLVHGLLRADEPTLRDDPVLRGRVLLPAESVVMHLPVLTRDY